MDLLSAENYLYTIALICFGLIILGLPLVFGVKIKSKLNSKRFSEFSNRHAIEFFPSISNSQYRDLCKSMHSVFSKTVNAYPKWSIGWLNSIEVGSPKLGHKNVCDLFVIKSNDYCVYVFNYPVDNQIDDTELNEQFWVGAKVDAIIILITHRFGRKIERDIQKKFLTIVRNLYKGLEFNFEYEDLEKSICAHSQFLKIFPKDLEVLLLDLKNIIVPRS